MLNVWAKSASEAMLPAVLHGAAAWVRVNTVQQNLYESDAFSKRLALRHMTSALCADYVFSKKVV